MSQAPAAYPCFRAVADHAVLVEFGDAIDQAVHDEVVRLDGLLAEHPFPGFAETVPAYVNLLVAFDPLLTDHAEVEKAVRALLGHPSEPPVDGVLREVEVCYDLDLAPDLPKVARATGLAVEAVIAAHLSGEYRVYMYGFAPGYAYLAGIPKSIQLPRKPSPVRGIAAGSVLIAGVQCLVTTMVMPTGWWIIGRSPTRILGNDPDRPFLFDVADRVRFRQISRSEFERAEALN